MQNRIWIVNREIERERENKNSEHQITNKTISNESVHVHTFWLGLNCSLCAVPCILWMCTVHYEHTHTPNIIILLYWGGFAKCTGFSNFHPALLLLVVWLLCVSWANWWWKCALAPVHGNLIYCSVTFNVVIHSVVLLSLPRKIVYCRRLMIMPLLFVECWSSALYTCFVLHLSDGIGGGNVTGV